MKKLLFALLAVAAIAGCNKNKNETGNIENPRGIGKTTIADTLLLQTAKDTTFYADDTLNDNAIKFKANKSWTVSVKGITADMVSDENKVDWLKLLTNNIETDKGDAGNINLTISLKKNYSGKERKAEISIKCGNLPAVKIKVRQKRVTKENNPLKLVSCISSKVDNNIDSILFEYDEKNRISKITKYFIEDNKESLSGIITITYEQGKMNIKESEYNNEDDSCECYELDEQLQVIRKTSYNIKRNENKKNDIIKSEYKYKDNLIVQQLLENIYTKINAHKTDTTLYTWDKGNLTTIKKQNSRYSEHNAGIIIEKDNILNKYSPYKNDLNIDINNIGRHIFELLKTPLLEFFRIMLLLRFVHRNKNIPND